MRFFVRGYSYELMGFLPTSVHLYGVDPPGRIFLFGSDSFGRDVLSRLLFGAQISLTVGLVGITISFTLGLMLGGIAGYFGGFIDTVIMRVTELLLSIPVAVPDHRAPRRVSHGSAEPSGVPRHRRDPGVHRLGRSRARHPRPGALDAQERLRDGGRGAGLRPASRDRAPRAAEHDVVRHRGGDLVDSRIHPRARSCCRFSASACRSRAHRGATC